MKSATKLYNTSASHLTYVAALFWKVKSLTLSQTKRKLQTKCLDFYMQPFYCISLTYILVTHLLLRFLIPVKKSKRGNINTAALVTIAQCNTLVARCTRQLIGPAD